MWNNIETWLNNYDIPSQTIEMESFRDLENWYITPYLNVFLLHNWLLWNQVSIQSKISNDWFEKISFPNDIKIQAAGRFFSIEYNHENGQRVELCYDILKSWESLLFTGWIHDSIAEQNDIIAQEADNFAWFLDAMEWIFERNSEESSFDFQPGRWYIWNEDTALYGELSGMHLVEVQAVARASLRKIEQLQSWFLHLSPREQNRLEKMQEHYLHMTLWIWDLYQAWGKAFAVSEEPVTYNHNEYGEIMPGRSSIEVSYLLSKMVMNRAPNIDGEWGIFEYYLKVQSMMNDSYAPDRTALMVYENIGKWLNAEIFEYILKVQQENPEEAEQYDAYLLEFAEMCSGRNIDMLSELHDPEMANWILVHIMSRKWGFLEKLYESWNIAIEDPEVWDKHPSEIVSSTIDLLQSSVKIITRDENGNEVTQDALSQEWAISYISQISGSQNILTESQCYRDYASMSLDMKVKISAIARLQNKLEANQNRLNSSGHTKRNAENYTNENFWDVLQEIVEDSFNDTVDAISDNFWFSWNGNFSDELSNMQDSEWNTIKFTQTEIDMFDLFHDIQGTGLFNLSDINADRAVTWWKIAVLLAAAFILTAATWWIAAWLWATTLAGNLVFQGAVMWAYAAPASWVIFPEWHTSTQEMLWDRFITDLPLSIWTWALGWVAAKTIWFEWARMLSSQWMWNGVIFGSDLYFLWILTEKRRNQEIAEYFHSDNIMQNPDFISTQF